MPLLNWKQNRAKVVPKNTPKGKKVKTVQTVILLPGYNEVSDKDWKAIEKNCTPRLEDECLELVTKKEGDKEIPISFAEIAQLDPERAREVIAATYNEKLLANWRKNCGRDEIRTAIANQIDELSNYTGEVKKRKEKIGR